MDSFFLWSDPEMVDIFVNSFGKPRDDKLMALSDRIIAETDPKQVGIVYGAAHVAYLRGLCEQKGYILRSSLELRNLSF